MIENRKGVESLGGGRGKFEGVGVESAWKVRGGVNKRKAG